ncbi:MAG: hypothetical protein PF439_06410 [Helicobacteraceae bacterium]|jgi:GGDEF domain-containing protein|nr:hypothetical protein [Helicobacteraceae bacterium]
MYIAESIRSNIEKGIPHENSSHLDVVTISLGVAISEMALNGTSVISSEELVKEAEIALYKSKE